MDTYEILKTLHIISATILFGTGLGIAFFFFLANRGEDIAIRFFAARITVLMDFVFTLPAVIIQPLTGFWLAYRTHYYPLTEAWLVITFAIYAVAGLCWVPVVFIQIKLKTILQDCVANKTPLPPEYHRLYRWWFALGWPAFIGLVAVFWLMVVKPQW